MTAGSWGSTASATFETNAYAKRVAACTPDGRAAVSSRFQGNGRRYECRWREPRGNTHEALAALRMALADRRPTPGLLHHSDRGSQYACGEYRALLAAHGLVASMSKKGDCWDNAVAESFFATLETEVIMEADWPTRVAARQAIFAYIE